jgi:hypothetical protein
MTMTERKLFPSSLRDAPISDVERVIAEAVAELLGSDVSCSIHKLDIQFAHVSLSISLHPASLYGAQ